MFDWLTHNLSLFLSVEYDYVLSLEGQIKLAKASTEEVAMETNAAYGLRAKDQLQTEEVLVEAYGIRKDLELNMEIVAITEDESGKQ